ncbi:oligosaccharide flippase family protein [Vibrio coralliilyticus]|uniref:lipopolysaccharide biosynthesis protein n=1 Tax=Vibrio coralliilyticus TaxID=190893 RepID=UPI000A82A73C
MLLKNKIFLLALKGFGLTVKMIFILTIAKLLSVQDVAAYGEFMSYLNIMLVIFGFEIYAYSQRRIATKDDKMFEIFSHLKTQAIISIPLFVLLAILYFIDYISVYSFYMLIVLLFFELIAQELARYLIALDRHVQAAIASFIRNGGWSLIVVILFISNTEYRNIDTLFGVYMVMSLISGLYSFVNIKKYFSKYKTSTEDGDFKNWFKESTRNSIIYFISGIGASLLFFIDRYTLSKHGTDISLATHTIFIVISTSVTSLLLSTVYSYNLPDFIRSVGSKDCNVIAKKTRNILLELIVVLVIVNVSAVIILPYLFEYIGKEEYLSSMDYFFVLLLVANINSLSYLPHYYMYASGMDKKLCAVSVTSVIVLILAIYILSLTNLEIIYTVGYSLLITFSYLFLIKSIISFRHFRVEK